MYHPEGLPDTLKGTTERETIDKLWKDIADRPKPPANATDYTISPDAAKLIGDVTTDPVLPLWRQIAHEEGIPQKTFDSVITKLYGKMTEAGLIEKPVDIQAEFAAMSDGKGDKAAQIAAGQRFALEVKSSIDGFAARGQLSKPAADLLAGGMLASAAATKAVGELVALAAKLGGVQPGGQPGNGADDPAAQEAQRLHTMFPSMTKAS